ncbi:uncharacterized protein LOC142238030 [Haematobia irritans]|uniref:uncharacterized protein LOC142238030 n=1 Tax=Haematobia irritans TaxID=7368 RepID=UPI003F4F8219
MAMLAEPRQRKRYNLVPRGKALYEDESRFGTKMLERMGWSKGKGLGAKEDGSQDFVRVRYKNDSQGLGFEHRDDQWTQHENSFNGLLKSLNGETNEEITQNNETDDELPRVGFGFQETFSGDVPNVAKPKLKENISGISLEERSKQSRARVHYKKFTRGKDLSQYSEKDLANIFGKKAADKVEGRETLNTSIDHIYKAVNNDFKVEKPKESDNFAGVQTICTGLSVSEYFNMKMARLKKKSAQPDLHCGDVHDATRICEDQPPKKKVKSKDKNCADGGVANNATQECIDITESHINERGVQSNEVEIEGLHKMKKKSKKRSKEKDGNIGGFNGALSTTSSEESKNNECKNGKNDKKGVLNKSQVHDVSKKIETISKADTSTNLASKDKSKNIQILSETIAEDIHLPENKRKAGDATRSPKLSRRGYLKEEDSEITIETIKLLSLQDIKEKINSFNICEISTFTAEKFRNVDLNYFPNSTLSHVDGYRYNKNDIQLRVSVAKNDEERINKLWSNTLCKYANLEIPKKTYKKYVKKVITARKNKQPRPKLNVKTWSRKNVFSNL